VNRKKKRRPGLPIIKVVANGTHILIELPSLLP